MKFDDGIGKWCEEMVASHILKNWKKKYLKKHQESYVKTKMADDRMKCIRYWQGKRQWRKDEKNAVGQKLEKNIKKISKKL